MMWYLCVVLTVSDGHRNCIDRFPVEPACWVAAADWTNRAIDWSHRSGIHLASVALCLPPEELTAAELNAFK